LGWGWIIDIGGVGGGGEKILSGDKRKEERKEMKG